MTTDDRRTKAELLKELKALRGELRRLERHQQAVVADGSVAGRTTISGLVRLRWRWGRICGRCRGVNPAAERLLASRRRPWRQSDDLADPMDRGEAAYSGR
jgi:hypothetical protein